jgi:hypothetical protein
VIRRAAVALVLLAVAACSPEEGGDGARPQSLQVFPASFDLAAGQPSRFLVGLTTPDNRFVSGGSVGLRFWFLGAERAAGEPQPAGEASASFLPLPGEEEEQVPPEPTAAPGDAPRGVYFVPEHAFGRPGLYEVEVTARIDGDARTGTGAFEVLPEPLVPLPGDPAPRSENPLLDQPGVPEEAVDSRAATTGIPDPELHRITIGEAIEAGRPALVVFATPVYCVSRFCGPVTDMVQGLAADYGDRAEFIHVEIWRDFEENVVNEAAAEWLLREGDLQEPWVFLVGADGRIVARWDNVATRGEIEPLLRGFPPMEG